jgi:hypothetical protein
VNDEVAGAGDTFRGQHDARVLGDGTVTVHDNGFHPTAQRPPRAVRFAIDTTVSTATIVEQKNDPDPIGTPVCCGDSRKLAGGNWLMSWGSDGIITELSPSGDRVLKLTFDDNLFSYRSHPVPYGTVSPPALRAGMDAQFPRGYARVKAAGYGQPMQVPLVPAYRECISPDRTHGPPLAFGSCSSPAGTSSFLTIGTPDANGAANNSRGFVAYGVRRGDPATLANEADVSIRVELSDVRWKSDMSDYQGQLQLRGAIRLTDQLNGPIRNESATVVDTELPASIQCTGTSDLAVGGNCSLATTVNAIVPGAVVEGKRAMWQLGEAQVDDGGASGSAGGSDAALFETQGLFVP